jgi:hypothetical protein
MTTTPVPTTCTVGPNAVTGERCGKPAVATFTGRDGTVYAECAEHYVPTTPRGLGIEVGNHIRVRHAGIIKVGTVVKVTATKVHVEVPVKPHGRPATTRVITFAPTGLEVIA